MIATNRLSNPCRYCEEQDCNQIKCKAFIAYCDAIAMAQDEAKEREMNRKAGI
jgi:hypothetical protein